MIFVAGYFKRYEKKLSEYKAQIIWKTMENV